MKIKITAAVVAMASTVYGVAVASEIEDKCVAVAAADETMPAEFDAEAIAAGCACIGEFADANPDVADEIDSALDNAALEDRMAALTGEALDGVNACLAG